MMNYESQDESCDFEMRNYKKNSNPHDSDKIHYIIESSKPRLSLAEFLGNIVIDNRTKEMAKLLKDEGLEIDTKESAE